MTLELLRLHKLVVFKSQHLDPQQLLVTLRAVGTPIPGFPAAFRMPGFPELTIVSNIFEQGSPVGVYDGDEEEEWHHDHSFFDVIPAFSTLYSLVSAKRGGATRFCDTTRALALMSKTELGELQGAKGLHSLGHLDENQRHQTIAKPELAEPEHSLQSWHPILSKSPLSGEPCMVLGKSVISQIRRKGDATYSVDIVNLEKNCTKSENVVSCHWENGDLAIWDNQVLMHTASPCVREENSRFLFRSLVHFRAQRTQQS